MSSVIFAHTCIAEGCNAMSGETLSQHFVCFDPLKTSRIFGENFAAGVFVGKEGGDWTVETEGNG